MSSRISAKHLERSIRKRPKTNGSWLRNAAELTKQLEAVQTELALLERLDAQLNHDSADAAELQKLLTVTEKKNRLSEKERKLKRCLKQL